MNDSRTRHEFYWLFHSGFKQNSYTYSLFAVVDVVVVVVVVVVFHLLQGPLETVSSLLREKRKFHLSAGL